MDVHSQTLFALVYALMLQLAGLAVAVVRDPYIRPDRRRILLGATFLSFTLILLDLITMRSNPALTDLAQTALTVYGYCVRPVVIALFLWVLSRDWRPWLLVIVNSLINLTAFFTGAVFVIRNGTFTRGPLGYTCHVTGFILLIWTLIAARRTDGEGGERRFFVPRLLTGFLMLSTVMDTWFLREYGISLLTVTIVASCLFCYIWLHLQFVREHERDLKAEQRIQIMVSQIQPHFLYNTLATIQSFCLTDPDKAFDTIANFGTYLRQNLDSLDQPELIPFAREMEHTKVYAEIEMTRFPRLRMRYDIRNEDFSVPALTVQPLVENAIRHGVRIREEGIVTVSSFREPLYHVIVIRDNGVGFDVETLGKTEGSHIGIRNVRERIEQMCRGTMTVESVIGEGTVVTIRIPAEGVEM